MSEIKQIRRLLQVMEESKQVRRLVWFLSLSAALIGLLFGVASVLESIGGLL